MDTELNILYGPEPTGEKALAWSRQVDVNFIKKIKIAAGTTVSDVLLTCVAGSIQKYFKAHASTIPQEVTFLVPVVLRQPGDKLIMDNRVSAFFTKLPTNVHDPL